MGKKKYKKKKKADEQRSAWQTTNCEMISSENLAKISKRFRQIGDAFGDAFETIGRQTVGLPLGGGTVRTARITSKGILIAGRKHYNSDYIQMFRDREVLIHEMDGKMKVYLYDETSKLLMRIICVVDVS